MKWLAPAKINLSLRLLSRRTDGFHEIESLMVPITLADDIALEPCDGSPGDVELVCSDPTLPVGEGNLAYRAAKLFQQRVNKPVPALRLVLTKRIPHGAGLGGGSSDAASVLLALNVYWKAGFETTQLAAMAAELGSDVPFFIYRSAAICHGRGEQVEPVPFGQPLSLLLLKPPFPVPTPLAYQRWKTSREMPGISYSAQAFLWGPLINDLERPVFEKHVLLADMKMWLLAQPDVAGALMSGSGSTMFAVLRSRGSDAGTLVARAQEQYGPLWTCVCSTLTR